MTEANQNDHDPGPEADRYEPIGVVGDPLQAKLIAARLRSEGIAVRSHGETQGPFRVGVGGMAEVEIWVDADRVEEAQQIVAAMTD
jgi:hypothetical protein